MLTQVHVQVCNTQAEWALGVVTKHKKKCKEAVNFSEHKSPCVGPSFDRCPGFCGGPDTPALVL